MKQKTTENLVRIDCPHEIFDVDGAYILRLRRVTVARLDSLDELARRRNKTDEEQAEMYRMMADIIPGWEGVLHPDTGDPLPNPDDDPTVFKQLDALEQLPWISRAMRTNPGNPLRSGRAQT